MKVIELAFCCYAVTDMKRAREFYEGVLNLQPTTVTDTEHGQWTEYEFGPYALALGYAPGFKPSPDGCSAALEVEDFDAAVSHLKQHDVKFRIEPMATPICRMAMIFGSRRQQHLHSQAKPRQLRNRTKKETTTMRFMVIVKATKNSEAGVLPNEQLLTEMGRYNEELTKAGVMLAGEGLHPSSKGARVRFSGEQRTVIDGPFAETKELVAGFWLWKCASLPEAIEWAKRCPNQMPGEEAELEIRKVFEAEDFGAEFTPELREQEERLRAEIEKNQAR